MKIRTLQRVIDEFKGGTITVDGVTKQIKGIREEPEVHADYKIFIVATDGSEFFCGYNLVEGIEHAGKFYINDERIVLEAKK
ncbi:hypothetical protein H0W91_01520 [Patescibacteria group bacterium]|nr:hypothetical protein [Patescibacteria group bacterium]